MTSAEKLRRLAAPTGRVVKRATSTGEGDPCPLVTSHGRMIVLRLTFGEEVLTPRQYCPHQSHDGSKSRPIERSSWPFDVQPGQLEELAREERERLAEHASGGDR